MSTIMLAAAHADGGGHGFGDGDDVAGAGVGGGVFHGAFFDLGDAGGYGDDDAGADAQGVVVHLADKVAQHRLGDIEVGDDAVFHRADGGDVAGGAAQHAFGFVANGTDLAGLGVESHDRGFTEDNALVFDVNERVGGAQIDADVVGEVAEERRHVCGFRGESGCAVWCASHAIGVPRGCQKVKARTTLGLSRLGVSRLCKGYLGAGGLGEGGVSVDDSYARVMVFSLRAVPSRLVANMCRQKI
jgi:hypothetical protein